MLPLPDLGPLLVSDSDLTSRMCYLIAPLSDGLCPVVCSLRLLFRAPALQKPVAMVATCERSERPVPSVPTLCKGTTTLVVTPAPIKGLDDTIGAIRSQGHDLC